MFLKNLEPHVLITISLTPCGSTHHPSLAWNAMLKKTKVSLELISDNSVLEFFESQLRGGISSVFHRYAEANSKYLDSYD